MRFAVVLAIATFAAGAALAAAPQKGSAPSVPAAATDLLALDREVSDVLNASRTTNSSFCRGRLNRLLALSGRPGFDRLPADTRRQVLDGVVGCDEEIIRRPEVMALLRRLEPLADKPPLIASVNAALIDGDLADGKPVEAGRRLLKVMDNDSAIVGRWWEPYVTSLLDATMTDRDLHGEIVRRLQAVPWTDQTSAAAVRNAWALRRADDLAGAGDLRGAEKMLARADEFDTLVLVAQERLYAPLWPKMQAAGRYEWREVIENELAFRRKLAADYPYSLRMALGVQRRLRLLERYDEAIAYGQSLREKLASPRGFSDRDSYGGLVLAELAFALLDVGRTAEAENVFKDAIAIGEGDGGDVAAKLDWIGRLNGLGRHADALALIAGIAPDDLSPYGAMWLGAERLCALSKTDPASAWGDLPRMLIRQADAPEAMQKALLCLNRTDEAAAFYVLRIRDPDRRTDAMGAARRVRRPPSVGPFDAELLRRRDAMLARPEVKAAIADVGRALDLPLSGTLFGWY